MTFTYTRPERPNEEPVMRAFIIFLVASGLVGTVVACSADADTGSSPVVCDKNDDDCGSSKKKKTTAPAETETPQPTVKQDVPDAAIPLPPVREAGVDSSSTPKPATTYCRDLNPCCLTLASTVEKFACVGVSLAGKEVACQLELALCSGGGVGGTPCANLNTCCDQMDADGYPNDADDCRAKANQNNSTSCSSWVNTYKSWGWCN
jgi:hypothetical protein